MTQVQNPGDQRNNHSNYQNYIINPFQRYHRPEAHQFMIEEFIRSWVQSIFYSSSRVDLQQKFDYLYKTDTEKAFQHTSCSTMYTMIRDTIEIVVWKLRDALDHSFDILKSSSRWLYKLSQTSSSWEINWMQFKYEADPQSFKNIYPPISNMYINFYKYMCDCTKEVNVLWKAIYGYIPIKDLSCDTFQQSINQLILDVFTTGSSAFRPKHMLPVISLANKCRFVNIDKEGTLKRMNLTKFKEDELAINLAKASSKKFKKMGLDAENVIKNRQIQDKKTSLKNRESSRPSARSRVDTSLIEEIRNQYLDSYKLTTKMQERIDKYRNVFQKLTADQPTDYIHSDCPQLLGGFTIEGDNSSQSQEDDLNDLQCDEKEELIDYNEEVEVEQMPIYEKFKEIEAMAKLSSSTGIEENADQNDILLKNDDLDNPPDFILQEQFSSIDAYQIDEKEESMTLQLSKRYLNRANATLNNEFVLTEKHGGLMGHHTVDKCRKRISKQHEKPREHSKCCLEQEKQKLEKYRKELQKEKQELLRQVQRFMKEKDRDTNLYRMAANQIVNNCSRKHSKNYIKYTKEIKQVDFNKYRATFKTNVTEPELGLWTKEQLQKQGTACFKNFKDQVDQSFCDEHSTGEATNNSQESWIDEINVEKKMSKRQQKLRKKIQREMNEFKVQQNDLVKSKTSKEAVSEEEAQLSNFLEQLNLGKSNRVACHIEEDRLDRWRSKIYTIRNKVVGQCLLKDNGQSKQQSKKKKKSKNRK